MYHKTNKFVYNINDATEIQKTSCLLHAQTLAVHLNSILELSTLSCMFMNQALKIPMTQV